MIKAEDLMINNWVNYEGKPYQIFSTGGDFPTLNTIDFGAGVVSYEGLEGVPITDGWVLKFGFLIKKFDYCIPISDCKTVWLTLISQDEFGSVYSVCVTQTDGNEHEENVFLSDISHIHQLQNLYLSLTGEPLTFKPNKNDTTLHTPNLPTNGATSFPPLPMVGC